MPEAKTAVGSQSPYSEGKFSYSYNKAANPLEPDNKVVDKQPDINYVDKPTEVADAKVTINDITPENAAKSALEGAKNGIAAKAKTAEKLEEAPKTRYEKSVKPDIKQAQGELDLINQMLTRDDKEETKNKYSEAQREFLENAKAERENIIGKKKTELSPEAQKIQNEIASINGVLANKENKISPEQRKVLEDTKAEKEERLREAIERAKGEVSPETIKRDKIIDEVAIMATNPKNNQNILENNKRVAYTKEDIKNILDTEKDSVKRAEKIKTYLIGSLQESVTLRNEAKYGKGWMAKLKKFMNEGWGGAITKTAAGAGLIASGLANPALGALNPCIYGLGTRMLAEGAMQLGQEVYDIFNKKSRKNLMEAGRDNLTKLIDAEMAKLMKNNEMSDDKKSQEAIMAFIKDTYAQEVTTLVDQDTASLGRAEKARKYAGWVGAAGGILAGMPMDIDTDGVSHFVNLLGNKWFEPAGIGHSLLTDLGTRGAIENIAGYLGGGMVTYMLNRGTEGREFKLAITTTESQSQELKGENKKIEEVREKIEAEETVGTKEKGLAVPKEKTPEKGLAIPEKNAKEKDEKLNEKYNSYEIMLLKFENASAEELKTIYEDKNSSHREKWLALFEILANHSDKISELPEDAEECITRVKENSASLIQDKGLKEKLEDNLRKATKNLRDF